jgi:hypothetical protein
MPLARLRLGWMALSLLDRGAGVDANGGPVFRKSFLVGLSLLVVEEL